MEHSFGQRAPFQLGIEDELLLVDPRTHQLSHRSEEIVAQLALPPEVVQLEFYAGLIELTSPVCADAAEAAAEISSLRASLFSTDIAAIGAGLHPSAAYGDVEPVPKPRWLEVADAHGRVNFRSVEAALHVHVGMPDEHTAVVVLNRLREELPVLLALSGNSPFWFGADARLASARTVQNRAFPRFEPPPVASSYDEYMSLLAQVVAAANVADYTLIWWHVRLHPKLGTVEVRIMDSQSSLRHSAGLAALIHGLALAASSQPPVAATPREVLAEGIYAASRYALDAQVWRDGEVCPLRGLAEDAVVEAASSLSAAGLDAEPLDGVREILTEGTGADRQRAAYERGGMSAVLRQLVEETATPL